MPVAQLLAKLAADPNVAKAEPDYVGHPLAVRAPAGPNRVTPLFQFPNDPFFSSQWAFLNTGQTLGGITGTPGADINAPAAWDISTGNKNVVLVDFDTGIDYNNPDLAPNVWTAPSEYIFYEGGNGYDCKAGTHGFSAVDFLSGCNGQEYDNGSNGGHGTFMAGGGGQITITTTAKGPYTGYKLTTSVSNDCVPASDCGRAPTVTHTQITAGH